MQDFSVENFYASFAVFPEQVQKNWATAGKLTGYANLIIRLEILFSN